MTQNRKRISVSIRSGSRSAPVSIRKGAGAATASIAALPVRVVDIGTPYDGAYTVDPEFTAQTLPTEGKRMAQDVTVNAIYVGDTSNPAGGVTVYIGIGGENYV